MNRASPKRAQSAATPSPARPLGETVARWLEAVRATGEPERIDELVWSPPPKDSPFFWLTDEITVPIEKREDGQLIACPFCSHGKPKFKKGRFCWFQVEGVTRFLGNVCAKQHLDDELVKQADRQWREEKRRAARDQFLRSNCGRVAELLTHARDVRSIASAADRAHSDLCRQARVVLAEIRRYAKSGDLRADETPGASVERAHQQSFRVTLGVLAGRTVLKSRLQLTVWTDQAIRQLEEISRDSRRAANGELSHMSQRRRDEAEILLRDAHSALAQIGSNITDFQAFFSERNIELLNRWAHHVGSDIAWLKATFVRQGLLFVIRRIGIPIEDQPRVTLPSTIFGTVAPIGPLS